MVSSVLRICTALVWLGLSTTTQAQELRGVVLDATGLPLPGATIRLFDGPSLVMTTTTGPDGSFVIDTAAVGDMVAASLDGFETSSVPRSDATRITLEIAHAQETTTVVAPTVSPSSPSATQLGNTLTAGTVARMPSSGFKARESLPLLPSVIRGPDGLMELGGARAHDTPLLLDGFNVTDPATGVSSVNLPYEAVQQVDVLRDPMAVSYGGLLAGVVTLGSKSGGDDPVKIGVQQVVPRPRFRKPGFGRLEGYFPRAYAHGATRAQGFRYFVAGEYDYERIPVPDVTGRTGPDLVERSATWFTKLDARLSARQTLTVEGFLFPRHTRSLGLSPLRAQEATTDVDEQDQFVGITHHFVSTQAGVLTLQMGMVTHEALLMPNGTGESRLTATGWHDNWFATVHRRAERDTAAATWERIARIGGRTHDLSLGGELVRLRLRSTVAETRITVQNEQAQTVRTIDFGPASAVSTADLLEGLWARDIWRVNERLQVDSGVRLDHTRQAGSSPSARAGVRYAVDQDGTTVLKAGYGSFVGTPPLAVAAFGAGYPSRFDRQFDPRSGQVISEAALQPTVGRLRLPNAVAMTVTIERQLLPGMDAQVSFTNRRSSRLARLDVPIRNGALLVTSSGAALYRELQVSLRRAWAHEQQLFISYVRASGRGELNDFTTLFEGLDAPLLQPGAISRRANDVPNRILVWGTFDLPRRIVASPVMELRSGFPYSALNDRYFYEGPPRSRRFPHFLSADLVVYKTFTVHHRSADVGVEIYNVTNHQNPRDVYAVVGAPRFGQFTNSVGPVVRGYLLLKW